MDRFTEETCVKGGVLMSEQRIVLRGTVRGNRRGDRTCRVELRAEGSGYRWYAIDPGTGKAIWDGSEFRDIEQARTDFYLDLRQNAPELTVTFQEVS
jgi:hypothetical protein